MFLGVFLTIFLFTIEGCLSLSCYDCGPSEEGRCQMPQANNVKITTCPHNGPGEATGVKKEIADTELDANPSSNETDLVGECFTLYFETQDDRTGIYRGCYHRRPDVLSACEIISEELKDGKVVDCFACGEDTCNTRDDIGGSAVTFTISLGIMLFNLLITLNVFNF